MHFNLKKKKVDEWILLSLPKDRGPPLNGEVPHKDKVLFSLNKNKEL